MTDRKTIAEACASRIMDRMEMCRGSAILKSDIAREVESAIDEMIAEFGLVGAPQAVCIADNIVECAMKALGDQIRSEPDMAFVDKAVYDALNQQIREHSGTPQSFWTRRQSLA
jgi:hypothetical protein